MRLFIIITWPIWAIVGIAVCVIIARRPPPIPNRT